MFKRWIDPSTGCIIVRRTSNRKINWVIDWIKSQRYQFFEQLGPECQIDKASFVLSCIDLVTVFDAILTSWQTREKLQCLYENLMSNNFRRMAVLKKI